MSHSMRHVLIYAQNQNDMYFVTFIINWSQILIKVYNSQDNTFY